MFTGLACAGLFFAVVLFIADKKGENVLNRVRPAEGNSGDSLSETSLSGTSYFSPSFHA